MTGDNRVSVIASLSWCSHSEYSVYAFSHSRYAHFYFQMFQKCVKIIRVLLVANSENGIVFYRVLIVVGSEALVVISLYADCISSIS